MSLTWSEGEEPDGSYLHSLTIAPAGGEHARCWIYVTEAESQYFWNVELGTGGSGEGTAKTLARAKRCAFMVAKDHLTRLASQATEALMVIDEELEA